MPEKIRWGILSTAHIGRKSVIPAMHAARNGLPAAVASRDIEKARAFAELTGIPKVYGSYEDLLADPEIDAIYNPLPNHLHAEWAIKAAARPNAFAHIYAIAAYSLALAGRIEEGRAYLASIHKALPHYGVTDFLTAMQFDPAGAALYRSAAKRLGNK